MIDEERGSRIPEENKDETEDFNSAALIIAEIDFSSYNPDVILKDITNKECDANLLKMKKSLQEEFDSI